jgi:hypothetical protein
MTEIPRPYGSPNRGVTAGDVERAADALLRSGERPTIDKVRQTLGTGSPNTINPLLDAWWKRLSARLDAGPAAFHRLPESVAHVAEALWMQALEEGRRRARLELKSTERSTAEQQQTLEVRSHVLTLREGELDSRLHDRDITIAALHQQLRELTLLLRKEQAIRDAQARRIAVLAKELHSPQRMRPNVRQRYAPTKARRSLRTGRAVKPQGTPTKRIREKPTRQTVPSRKRLR